MIGLVLAAGSVVIFGGMYLAGIVEARQELRRTGRWVEPLPRARIRRRKQWLPDPGRGGRRQGDVDDPAVELRANDR